MKERAAVDTFSKPLYLLGKLTQAQTGFDLFSASRDGVTLCGLGGQRLFYGENETF